MGIVSAARAHTYPRLAHRREELRSLARRGWEVVLVAAIIGVLTGAGVSVLETVVIGIEERVYELPLWVVAGAPAVGLALTAMVLRWVGGGVSPSTADEYLRSYHDPVHPLPMRAFVARMMGAVSTLGLGGAMGLEGSSIYIGTTVGSRIRSLPLRLFRLTDRRVVLVAGAAAGVAAIFKAPATGAVFALEVPYQDEFARHMLIPSLVGAATGYLTFAAFHGTEPLFAVAAAPPFRYIDLIAALALGVAAGLGARLFARSLRWAKGLAARTAAWRRVLVAGVVIAGLIVASELIAGEPLAFGPGYEALEWTIDPDRALWAVAAMLVVRCLATTSVIGGGGVGGLFVPLVVAGALLGRFVGGALHELETSLFTVVGVAAFLGAGYRVPLAGVMFVAEATGHPGFVVPGLLAAVAAELVMGRSSVTAYQEVGTRSLSPASEPPGPPPQSEGARSG
jgi:CIC family chloride channel protein